ncbi:replication initiator protein [Dipodfec virus UOA04_Rod_582]|nr:replication initiator protein [Dipodfec virus UOA04_Rod_582]
MWILKGGQEYIFLPTSRQLLCNRLKSANFVALLLKPYLFMCENPLIILSPQAVSFAGNSCAEIYYEGVEYHCTLNASFISEFLRNYHNYPIEKIYEVVKSSVILYKGSSFPIFTALPCSKCKFCRESHRKQIEYRAIIEAANSGSVFFFTLTYDDLHVPADGLVKSDVIKAMKNLRNYIKRYLDFDCSFTVLYCGEYGGKRFRPHYHGMIFVHEFLTQKQIFQIEELFCPTCSHFNEVYRYEMDKGNEFRFLNACKSRHCLPSQFYKDHPRLEGVWPHGIFFDFQSARNSIALCRYITKYITKNAEFICDSPDYFKCIDRLEGHKNPFFIQMPKSVGLGCRYMHLYRDSILCSHDMSIAVRTPFGGVLRVGIPHIYVQKLFPGLSSFCPNCIFTAHVVSALISYYKRCWQYMFDSPIFHDSHLLIGELMLEFAPYEYLTKYSLRRKQMLKLDVVIGCIIGIYHNSNYKTSLHPPNLFDEFDFSFLSVLKKHIDILKSCPTQSEYESLMIAKSNWYRNKVVPEMSVIENMRCEQYKIWRNLTYTRRKMVYSDYNFFDGSV